MNNKRTFEKVLIFGLLSIVAIFAAASISSAALTLSGTSVVSDGALTLTGGAASTLDIGTGLLSIQTSNNGPITFGTGAFTVGGVASTSELRSPSSTLTNVSSTRITVGTSIDGAKGNLTNVSSTNVDVVTRFTSANVSSTRIDATTGGTIVNVSSTRITAATSIDGAAGNLTNVSSTNVDVVTRFTSANVSSTNATMSGYMAVGSAGSALTRIQCATGTVSFGSMAINGTSTVDFTLAGATTSLNQAYFAGIATSSAQLVQITAAPTSTTGTVTLLAKNNGATWNVTSPLVTVCYIQL